MSPVAGTRVWDLEPIPATRVSNGRGGWVDLILWGNPWGKLTPMAGGAATHHVERSPTFHGGCAETDFPAGVNQRQ